MNVQDVIRTRTTATKEGEEGEAGEEEEDHSATRSCGCYREGIVRISPDRVHVRTLLGMGSFSEVFSVDVDEEAAMMMMMMMSVHDDNCKKNNKKNHEDEDDNDDDDDNDNDDMDKNNDCDAISVISGFTDSTGYLSHNSCSTTHNTKAAKQQQQQQRQQQQYRKRSVRGYALKRLRFNNTIIDSSNDSSASASASVTASAAIAIAQQRAAHAQAAEDLLWEVELLSNKKLLASHPNIISLLAVSDQFFSNPETGFLILERLSETLEFRLKLWKLKDQRYHQRKLEQQEQQRNPCFSWLLLWPLRQVWRTFVRFPSFADPQQQQQRHKRSTSAPPKRNTRRRLSREHYYEQRQQFLRLQSSCALALAGAMDHLHRHGILYRDLKPANIGFVANGSLRLFDFGLAVSVAATTEQQLSGLTTITGTPGYMAPEVASGQSYGLPADVYSFGMVLWQVCTMDPPYNNSDNNNNNNNNNNNTRTKPEQRALRTTPSTSMKPEDPFGTTTSRPCLERVAWPEVRTVLEQCWDTNPKARPTFCQLSSVLHALLRVNGKVDQQL